MHPHLIIHFQPAEKATKRMFAEIYHFVIINSKGTESCVLYLCTRYLFLFSFVCCTNISNQNYVVDKGIFCVNMTQISVQWPDIFNGFYVTTMRMSE